MYSVIAETQSSLSVSVCLWRCLVVQDLAQVINYVFKHLQIFVVSG